MGLGAGISTSSGQHLSLGVDSGSMYTSTEAAVMQWAAQVNLPAGLQAFCLLGSPDQIHLE